MLFSLKRLESTDEAAYTTTMNSTTGFFCWANTSVVDGSTQNVLVSDIEADGDKGGEQKIYINYVQGTNIYHDPKIGIEGLLRPNPTPRSSSSSDEEVDAFPVLETVITLGIIATISAVGLLYLRQKKLKAR